jgi:hypothetical protein
LKSRCIKERRNRYQWAIQKFAFVILAYPCLTSCMPPSGYNSINMKRGKVDPGVFQDKIPLVDAVKKACLVSELTTNGSDQIIGPRSGMKLEENFLRSMLVHCRISQKTPGAPAVNTIAVTFSRGADANNIFNPLLPYYNLIAAISVNGEQVFQAFETSEKFEALRLGEINTPELAVIMSLEGVLFPKNPVTAFKRACDSNSTIRSLSGDTKLKVENLRGLEESIRVAPIETKDFCVMNGVVEKCDVNWEGCVKENGTMLLCDPSQAPVEVGAVRKQPIERYGWEAMSRVLNSGDLDYPFEPSSEFSKAIAFDVKIGGTTRVVWLQNSQYVHNGNSDYDPARDKNCNSPEELRLVQAVRGGTVAPWLDADSRSQIQCLDESKPLSYKGVSMNREACGGENVSFATMPYPKYSKVGYCSMSLEFETILDGSRVFSIGYAAIGGSGIGISGMPEGSCYSTISVAE